MQVLPVLDILHGVVVRGIAGRRDDYRPIVSQLTSSHEPMSVARAIRSEFGLKRLYIADLDGILDQRPNLALYHDLIADGFRLLIDPGIRELADVRVVLESTNVEIVVGLETCRTPIDLAQAVGMSPGVTFSLDLFQGIPRRVQAQSPRRSSQNEPDGWSDRPEEILRQAITANVKSMIVLDLSDVGTGTGGSTDSLCKFVHREFPKIQLITGGGVRGREDLKRLSELGVHAALVASALHDRRIQRDEVSSLA